MKNIFLPLPILFLLQACSFVAVPEDDRQFPLQAKVVAQVLQEKNLPQKPQYNSLAKDLKSQMLSFGQKNQKMQDNSCAYSYFLWGTQAEYNKRYDEALASYEKALICTPNSLYIKQKIPSLMFALHRYDEATTWLQEALTQNPDNLFFLQLLAGNYLQQKKTKEGIAVYSRLLALQPDDENTVSRLAIIHLQQSNYDQAIALLKNFLKTHANAYDPRVTLARIYSQHKDYPAAIRFFEEAQKLQWTEEIAAELALNYRQVGELQKAEELYRKMMTDGLQYEEPAFMLVKLFLDEEKYQEALDELNQLRPLSQDTAHIDYSRSQILLKQNKRQEAKTLLDKLVNTICHNDACYLLAILAYQDKKPEICLRYLQLIEKDSDKFQQSVFLQAHVYEQQKAYGKAITTLTANLPKKKRTPFFYTALASLYDDQKKSRKAIETLHNGLTCFPDSAEILYNLGLSHENAGKHDLALSTMEKLIIKQPDHAEALNFLGYSWADSNIKLNQAYSYISKANTLKPDNAFILDSLGWVLYRMGEMREASDILERALLLLPDNHLILEHLGDVNLALKRYDAARKYYTKAYNHAHNSAEQQRIRGKLENLQ